MQKKIRTPNGRAENPEKEEGDGVDRWGDFLAFDHD